MSARLIAAPIDWEEADIERPRYWAATATGWRLRDSGHTVRPLTDAEQAMARALCGSTDAAPLARPLFDVEDLARLPSPVSVAREGARVLSPQIRQWIEGAG